MAKTNRTFSSGSQVFGSTVSGSWEADIKQTLEPITFNSKQKNAMSWGLAPLVLEGGTMTADDTTPSVKNINVLTTVSNSGATAITQLDGALAGQVVMILTGHANNPPSITDGGNFIIAGDHTPNAIGDNIVLYTPNGTTWYEISRANNA